MATPGKSLSDCPRIMPSVLRRSLRMTRLAPSWYEGFKKRNPTVALMKPQKLSVARAKATSEEVLTAYFNELESV